MTQEESIGAASVSILVVTAASLAIGTAFMLRRWRIVAVNPVRYLPHLAFLFTVALTSRGVGVFATTEQAIILLGRVVAIWLVGVWLVSISSNWFSRKLPNTR